MSVTIVYGPKYYKFQNVRFADGFRRRESTTAVRINEWCARTGTSVNKLGKECAVTAKRLGMSFSPGNAYQYASGRCQPKTENAQIVALTMGIPLNNLLGYGRNPRVSKVYSVNRQLIDSWRREELI